MSNCCNGCVHKDSFLGRDNKPRYYCELTLIVIDDIFLGHLRCPLTAEEKIAHNLESEW